MLKLNPFLFPPSPRSLQNSNGNTLLYWGGILTPLFNIRNDNNIDSSIPRCSNCYGYINKFVNIDRNEWICNLCNNSNHCKDINNNKQSPDFNIDIINYTDECHKTLNYTFVVFLCNITKLKQSLIDIINNLPDIVSISIIIITSRIGIVKFSHLGSCIKYYKNINEIEIFFYPLKDIRRVSIDFINSLQIKIPNNCNQDDEYFYHVVNKLVTTKNDEKIVSVCSFLPEHFFRERNKFEYREIALKAMSASISFHLFIDSLDFKYKCSLNDLALLTGGIITSYDNVDFLYKLFTGFHGLLRIRTQMEIYKIHKIHGLQLHPDYNDDIFIVPYCNEYSNYCLTFAFNSFHRFNSTTTFLQMAFSYYFLDPIDLKLKKATRIMTMKVKIAQSFKELYNSCIPEILLKQLYYSLMTNFSRKEAQVLISKYLVELSVCFANYNNNNFESLSSLFQSTKKLKYIPQYLFALAKFFKDCSEFDLIFVSFLAEHHFVLAIYPSLTKLISINNANSNDFSSVLSSGNDKLKLSSLTIENELKYNPRNSIFLLNSHSSFIVYYSLFALTSFPFPLQIESENIRVSIIQSPYRKVNVYHIKENDGMNLKYLFFDNLVEDNLTSMEDGNFEFFDTKLTKLVQNTIIEEKKI